ncbi:MAG TPA: winged helix-turn-helix domain-containing protein [archaeon]|nr:winged helix-turn-helix domain-containing protein [archaeon]
MKKDIAELVSFIVRGSNRIIILNCLALEELTPSQIKKKTNLYLSHISRVIQELLDRKLIICINPDSPMVKFYAITKKGKTIIELVRKYKKE